MATKHRFFDEAADVKERTDSMAAAFNNPSKYPDLTVTCGDRTWHCHKVVLGSRSDWFEKAMSGKFQEGGAGTIAVLEEDLDAFEAMLEYCYGLKIDGEEHHSALFCVKMLALGEKYFVEGLPELAADRFATSVRDKDRKNEDLRAAILETYNNTGDTNRILRNTIQEIMVENSGKLMNGEHEKSFNDLVDNSPDFAAEMAKAFSKSLKRKQVPSDGEGGGRGPGWYECPYECGGTTFSTAVLIADAGNVGEVSVECSRCGLEPERTPLWWKTHCGT